MRVAIQINSYRGDGTPLETEYVFGYVELNTVKKEGKMLIDRDSDEVATYINFNIDSFEMFDIGMALKGTNQDGYGKIDICMGTEGSCIWDLAGENKQKQRLTRIHNDTKKFYEDRYGDINDINTTARVENYKAQIAKYTEKIESLKKYLKGR